MSATGFATPTTAASLRPLQLAHGAVEHTFLVSTALHANCTQLRDQFLKSLEPEVEFTDAADLVAKFLGFLAATVEEQPGPFDDVLSLVLGEFETRFLQGNDVHTIAAGIETEDPNEIVRSYYLARQLTNRPIKPHVSALLRAAEDQDTRLNLIFGGQGTSDSYFDELANIAHVYPTFVTPFLELASSHLRNLATSHPGASKVYGMGLDPLKWVLHPDSRPSKEYLLAAPVSVPVIGVIQLCHYLVTCAAMGITPGEFSRHVSGATGHSQGVVVALALSTCQSWEEFFITSTKTLSTLFFIGFHSQQAYPDTSMLPSVLEDSIDNNEGTPSPMLAVKDVPLDTLQQFVDQTNKYLPEEKRVAISLINGPKSFVVSGPPMSLYGLNRALRAEKVDFSENQGRIPFSERKLRMSNRFLPITSPFHSTLLQSATPRIVADIKAANAEFKTEEMLHPVYDTHSGENLRDCTDLTHRLVELITELTVKWELATAFPGATHIIDFGPGGSSGMAMLTHRNKDGTGCRVIVAGQLDGKPIVDDLGYKQEIFDRSVHSIIYAPNWLKKFSPKLAKTKNGQVYVDTKFSRLLGRPHLMVPGMVPATVKPEVVSATLNAGYHIELGGGAYFNPNMLKDALSQVSKSTEPGVGLSLNVLYVNPMMLQWCIPLIRDLREQGFPIEGLTIGAGVPSVEVGNEYIRTLGLKHISFKPGSVESLLAACQIAAENPTFPVIIQWTGGRGGGHHSFEDFHQPLLSTYSRIRKHDNIILVAGSGFGDDESSYPYLTGEWSVKFDYPPMPFDGFLFGSRMMVAKEFATSPAAKELIASCPGVTDDKWEGTYKKPTGGIITVMSEMGEPIHKIATRGVMLWKELDDTIFSIPRNKRLPELLKRKATLVPKLNRDSQKPWFPKSSSTDEVVDLGDMTYIEVVNRLIELMFVESESRWIDPTLCKMTGDFIRRVEERFTAEANQASLLQSLKQLQQPFEFAEQLAARYPLASEQTLNTQDKDYFLALCMNPAKKPVPFIPVLDDNFEFYFKKDSLWQSQDLAAVVDADVQRTCILQSPVSVRYANKVDEPVKSILDGINNGHIARLLKETYDSDESKIPVVESFGTISVHEDATAEVQNVVVRESGTERSYVVEATGELPDTDAWLALIADGSDNWRHAILSADRIVQGRNHVSNALRRVFSPSHRCEVVVNHSESAEDLSVKLYEIQQGKKVMTASLSYAKNIITAVLREHRTFTGKPVDLELQYQYKPEMGFAPVHEIMEGRNNRIKAFYWKVWFGDIPYAEIPSIQSTWSEDPVTVDSTAVKNFVHAVGNRGEAYVDLPGKKLQAPMDFAIVLGWKAIIRAIFPEIIDGDLLKLVHLSNGFELCGTSAPLSVGDKVSTVAKIKSVTNGPAGKVIEVVGDLIREGEVIMRVNSQFLYRGEFEDFDTTFSSHSELPMVVHLETPKDVAILLSKEWFHPAEGVDKDSLLGKTLVFRCESSVSYKNTKVFSHVETCGRVEHVLPTKEVVNVGSVEYTAGESFGNPVVDYLKRAGKTIEQPVKFERPFQLSQGVLESRAPASNVLYAQVSGDYNPIHVSRVFANYAGLPGTITHGMYSSASTRALVETWAAENHVGRVSAFNCVFQGMVLPNDALNTKIDHVGMINGRKLIDVTVSKVETGETVLKAEAEVDQPTTAYFFTGQGSQEQGMGMDLYNSSEVAREVWDRADRHFIATYGISILNIVRNNPKELTVHFGGESGKRIRENYISMMFENVDPATNETKLERIFKTIDEETDHYTFISPDGVLAMTQFTQPALTLMEKAGFEDMRSRGLINENCSFAGHSLGEYAALASLADVMPVESLVDIVFYRGMTMQVAVPRDSQGRSNYGMVAVNPSRISASFSELPLRMVIKEISSRTGWLLEIVNYNVANQQYVAAGDLRALDTLTNVLNLFKIKKIDVVKLQEMMSEDELRAHLFEIVDEVSARSTAKPQPIELERGFAVIPLPGISVPFHSSYLRSGVNPFKKFLSKRISKHAVKPSSLVGKYIPNLTAKPFEITKEYFQEVYDLTGSSEIKRIIDNWESYVNA